MTIRKLAGEITELNKSRRRRDFVLSRIGAGTEASALAASLSGMDGAAVAIANLDTTETADYVEFTLDGKPLRGWFWRFPFSDGDEVEVVAEASQTGPWSALGVRRESDGLVAVHPHCFEGRWSHYVSTFKFWGIVIGAIFLFLMCLDPVFALFRGTFSVEDQLSSYVFYVTQVLPLVVFVFGFLAWRGGRKTEAFAQVAETIFKGFGWTDPGKINLRTVSKKKRKPSDGRDYSLRYFRY